MEISIPISITQYYPYILPFFTAFLISFLITPFVGKLADKLEFKEQAISKKEHISYRHKKPQMHKNGILRLGGITIIISFFVSLIIFDNVPTNLYGVLIGMLIITILGIIDDKKDLPGKTQLFVQILAASVVVVFGVTIPSIHIIGQSINFNLFSHQFNMFGLDYNFIFPADIITVFWILLVMNAFAWTCGIDALGESLAIVASLVFAALSVKYGNFHYPLIFFIFAGSISGFTPYNFPKAKIIAGSVGDMNFGFLLSSMAIVSGTKLPTATMILIIPILDMIWVLIGRIKRHRLSNPLKILSISDDTHLHHRIMKLGFNVKETLYIELAIFSIFSFAAFYLAGFSFRFLLLSAFIVVALIIFAILNALKGRSKLVSSKSNQKRIIKKSLSPEDRYAY